MGDPHLVVDGSNIATEGRSLPSLQQLLEAVDAIKKEFSYENVTVIVDATFGHRIDASERDRYDEATSTGEIITPPAGVIGRGDAFILEVADRADAVVLSNDSFQEFHGKYTWLFDEGRLLGGKHVPGVGWIFLARSPVRGPTSRKAVSDAKRKRRGSKQAASTAPAKSSRGRSSKAAAKSSPAPAKKKSSSRASGERKSAGKEPEPYNEPLPFIEFVGAHPVGSVVEGEVEQFSSHGAYVMADGTRCYVSLKSIADPAPRSAREVLNLGETREWVVQAIDTPRRGIDLAVPGMERTGEDDDAEQDEGAETSDTGTSGGRQRRRRRSTEDEVPAPEPATAPEPIAEESAPPARTAPATRAEEADASEGKKLSVSQRRKLRAQQAAAREAESEQATEPARETMAKKAAAKKSATKKAAAKKSGAKRAAAKKSTAKKAAVKKSPAKKSAAKKTATKKKSTAKKAPAKKKSAAKKTTAKKAPAKKKSAAKKTATKKKSTAKKAPAKRKAPAKKSAAEKRSS